MIDAAPGEVIRLGEAGLRERLLWIDPRRGHLVTIDIDAATALPITRPFDEVAPLFEDGAVQRLEDPWLRPVLEERLTPAVRQRRDASWALILPLVHAQPEIYYEHERATRVADVAGQAGSNRFTLYRLLRRYWQRGMVPNALLPDYANSGGRGKTKAPSVKKRGTPVQYGIAGINVSAEMRELFRASLQRYFVKNKKMSKNSCYERCLREFFSKTVVCSETGRPKLVLVDDRPSLRQFSYWMAKDNDPLALDRKRRTPRVYDMDRRGLLSSSRVEVEGPADRFQIDATTADIYLVSRFDRRKIVGRPTIYVVVDVFSGLIVGLYIGFEHPTWLGAMMALANAAADKVAWCAQFGIEITEARLALRDAAEGPAGRPWRNAWPQGRRHHQEFRRSLGKHRPIVSHSVV